jgi:hypothetical protein
MDAGCTRTMVVFKHWNLLPPSFTGTFQALLVDPLFPDSLGKLCVTECDLPGFALRTTQLHEISRRNLNLEAMSQRILEPFS